MTESLSIVLLGGGLCNSVVLRILHDFLSVDHPQVRLTLISDWEFTYYSAMYPGVIAGQYSEEETRIDLEPLAFACNAEFILGKAVKVDPTSQQILLEDDRVVPYDILSINIGSRTLGSGQVPGVKEWAILTRPMNVFLEKLRTEEERCQRQGIVPKLLVVGGGVSGVELICSIKHRLEKLFSRQIEATLIDKNPKIENSARVARWTIIARNLKRYKIETLNEAVVKQICAQGDLELADGTHIYGDIIIWATGPEAQPLITCLSSCNRGFIRVTQSLRSLEFENVFAGGDCITMQGMPVDFPPKTGVHAVQEGPILALNVIAYARMKLFRTPLSLMLYEPPSDLLQLINFGDGRGLSSKYGMSFSGKWAFELKNYNDLKLIKRFSPIILLGSEGYRKYLSSRSSPNAKNLIYHYRQSTSDNDWQRFVYDTEMQGDCQDKDVRALTPQQALDMLLEASDLLKATSSLEYLSLMQVFKRADMELSFRSEMQRLYQKQAIEELDREET